MRQWQNRNRVIQLGRLTGNMGYRSDESADLIANTRSVAVILTGVPRLRRRLQRGSHDQHPRRLRPTQAVVLSYLKLTGLRDGCRDNGTYKQVSQAVRALSAQRST